MTSQESITNYVKNANIFDYSANEVLSDTKGNTLRQTIKDDLLVLEVPSLIVDEVIDSEELDMLISDYVYDYLQYIIYDANKPVFPSQGILNILIEKYSSREGKILSGKQREEVLNYIKLLGNKIDQGLLDQSEVNEMISLNIIKKIATVFSSEYTLIVIGIILTILIAIITICLGSIKKAINWCSKMAMLDGVLLIIASFVEVRVLIMYFNSQGLIDSLAISIVENGFQNMLVYGIVLIVIGIVFMTISGLSLKKASKTLSHNVEKESKKPVIKENEKLQAIVDEEKEVADNKPQEIKEEPKKENNNNQNNNQPKKEEQPKQENKSQEVKEEPKKENNNNQNNNQPKKEETPKQENKPQEVKEEPKKENSNNQNNNQPKKEETPKQENKPQEVKEEPKKENNNNQNNNQPKKEETPKQENKPQEVKEEPKKENNNNQNNNQPKKEEGPKQENKPQEIKEEPKKENNNLEIKPLQEAEINLVLPLKGEEIEVNHNEQEEEEDIEIL
ncbi:MAG: hypothetical protein IJL74_01965 [Bacilli bacterium]|nr:hypothetical protein [Bacilli bacterium]